MFCSRYKHIHDGTYSCVPVSIGFKCFAQDVSIFRMAHIFAVIAVIIRIHFNTVNADNASVFFYLNRIIIGIYIALHYALLNALLHKTNEILLTKEKLKSEKKIQICVKITI